MMLTIRDEKEGGQTSDGFRKKGSARENGALVPKEREEKKQA